MKAHDRLEGLPIEKQRNSRIEKTAGQFLSPALLYAKRIRSYANNEHRR